MSLFTNQFVRCPFAVRLKDVKINAKYVKEYLCVQTSEMKLTYLHIKQARSYHAYSVVRLLWL
jgi:hypothetical protein